MGGSRTMVFTTRAMELLYGALSANGGSRTPLGAWSLVNKKSGVTQGPKILVGVGVGIRFRNFSVVWSAKIRGGGSSSFISDTGGWY